MPLGGFDPEQLTAFPTSIEDLIANAQSQQPRRATFSDLANQATGEWPTATGFEGYQAPVFQGVAPALRSAQRAMGVPGTPDEPNASPFGRLAAPGEEAPGGRTDAGPRAAGPGIQPSTYTPSTPTADQAAESWRQYNIKKYGYDATGGGTHSVETSPELIQMKTLNDLMERPDVQANPMLIDSLLKQYQTQSGQLGGQLDAVNKANAAQGAKDREARTLKGIYELIYGEGAAGGAEGITPEEFKLGTDAYKSQADIGIKNAAQQFNMSKAIAEQPIPPAQVAALQVRKLQAKGYTQDPKTKQWMQPHAGWFGSQGTPTPVPTEEIAQMGQEAQAELQSQQQQRGMQIQQHAPGYGRPAGGGPRGSLMAGQGGQPQGAGIAGTQPIEETDPDIQHILALDRENPGNPIVQHYNYTVRRLIRFGMSPIMAKRASAQIALGG